MVFAGRERRRQTEGAVLQSRSLRPPMPTFAPPVVVLSRAMVPCAVLKEAVEFVNVYCT